jgi:hypothetical protein
MKLLHEIIPSPRAGKRFINIYRLIRATVNERERSAFVGDVNGGEYQCAMLLLAILTGYPPEATAIFRDLIHRQHTETWWKFIGDLRASRLVGFSEGAKFAVTPQQRRWEELLNKLDGLRPAISDRSCADFVKWAPRIARYSFQSGRVLSNAR